MRRLWYAQIVSVLGDFLANLTSVRRVFGLSTAMLLLLALAGKLWMEPRKPNPAATPV